MPRTISTEALLRDKTRGRVSRLARVRWVWERRAAWQDLPDVDNYNHHWYASCLHRLAMEAREKGLYAKTTYIIDIQSSLWRAMHLARRLHKEGVL